MADVGHAIQDEVAYIGLKNRGDHLRLHKCMEHAELFGNFLYEKLARTKTPNHDEKPNTKVELRKYLQEKVELLANEFKYTVVTDFAKDHLLRVFHQDKCFVYFGAMTENLIHVACWLLIPMHDGKIDKQAKPHIVFWVLHASYAQELEALSELELITTDQGEQHAVLDLTDVREIH
jgi:hypothetical protein